MFWRTKSFPVLTFLLLAAFALSACGQGNNKEDGSAGKEPFLIGVIPAQGSNLMKDGADHLAAILTDALGREVKAEVYPDYNGVVEAMGANKVQMAYLGPLTYVEAHERYDVEAVATQLINGEPYYYSYLIAPADSPYTSLDDVVANAKDIRFAFGDINSTSGSLIPGIALKKTGIFTSQQDTKLKSVVYTGDHLATALAVQNKQQDVGAIDSAYFEYLIKDGKIDESKFKIIWKSEQLFQYPWAVVPSTSKEDMEAIQEAMVKIDDKTILDAFGGATGIIKASNDDYAAIRSAAIEDGRIKPKS